MSKSYRAALFCAALLVLGGCGSLSIDATCTIDDWTITCRKDKQGTQDLSATGVAEDEKPVNRPFAQPLQRLEEDAP